MPILSFLSGVANCISFRDLLFIKSLTIHLFAQKMASIFREPINQCEDFWRKTKVEIKRSFRLPSNPHTPHNPLSGQTKTRA